MAANLHNCYALSAVGARARARELQPPSSLVGSGFACALAQTLADIAQ